jgi:drug/metabolite transporter (DMT)-like permease
MLAAALLHASWHSLVKSGRDQIVAMAGMGVPVLACVVALLPFVSPPPPLIWPVMLGSAALHIAYKLCLVSAYARGDFGQAFPLARGMVPPIAMLIAFLVLGQVPTSGQLAGIALVSGGLLLLAIEQLPAYGRRKLLSAAAGAGAAVAGYSVLDAYGTRLYGDWLGFTVWLVVLDGTIFLALCRCLRGPSLWAEISAIKVRAIVSGILGLSSFGVFLWALSRSPVGPVTAVRETSVLFAVLIGVLVHRERFSIRRVGGATCILMGVLAIAL